MPALPIGLPPQRAERVEVEQVAAEPLEQLRLRRHGLLKAALLQPMHNSV